MAQTRKLNVSREAIHGLGTSITCTAVGAITGQRLVKVVSGGVGNKPKVSVCGAGEKIFGISGYDTADGGDVSVWLPGTPAEVRFTAAGVTGGAQIESAAAGLAKVLASGLPGGILTADVASGAVGVVKLT